MSSNLKVWQTLSMSGFRNLKIWQKLALVVVLLSLPVVFLLYLLVQQQSEQIHAAQLQIEGVEYLRPLERLEELLPEQKVFISETVAGRQAVVSSKVTELDEAFSTTVVDG